MPPIRRMTKPDSSEQLLMTPSNSSHSETDLAVALKALLALAPSDKNRTQKDVSKFLKELTDFVSDSDEEIAAAYMKEALTGSDGRIHLKPVGQAQATAIP